MYIHNIIKGESWEISTWKGIILGYHPQTGMTCLHGLRNTVCCTVHKFKLKLTKLKKPTVSVNMTQKQSSFPGSSFQMDWGNVENFSVVRQTKCEIIFRKHQWCVLQTKEGTRDRQPCYRHSVQYPETDGIEICQSLWNSQPAHLHRF